MKKFILILSLASGMFAAMALRAADAPAATDDASASTDQTPQPPSATDAAPAPAVVETPVVPPVPPTPTSTPVVAAPATDTNMPPPLAPGEKGLRMNFRNAPLEAVLNYMSEAAGFIIHPKVDVSGKVTVWSAKVLNSDEAVTLLKQMLNENGYTTLQEGRTLTIIRTSDAAANDIPTKFGADPELIPKNSEIVTQIIPVHSLNVVQLVKDLQPLRPSDSTLTADESANALVMTGTQQAIHRVAEIVKALDSVTSSSATIRVFPLKYADSKTLSSLVKDLFPSADTRGGTGGGGFNFGRFRGGGGGGGGFNPFGGGGGGDAEDKGHTPTAKVYAVSDDHSNSLVVSAPDALIDTIEDLVKQVDVPVEDTTEMHVFHLKNADPTETAELLTSLFPDDTGSSDATRSPFPFAGGFGRFGGGQNNNNAANGASDRMKKMAKVTAVADRRTASLVVTAGKNVMDQIITMVGELDARSDRKQTPHIIPLANADPVDVQNILQELFPNGSTGSRTGNNANSTTSNPLLNRQTTILQQQNSQSSSGFGNSTGSSSRTGTGF